MAVVCSGAGTGALLSANPRWTTPLSRGAPRSSIAAASATTRLALCVEATGGRMGALGVHHNSQEKEELLSQRLAIRSCRSHPRRMVCLASGDSAGVVTSDSVPEIQVDGEPKPIVLIDQDSNPHATTVEISFGDRLGALLDTIKAIKDLGLNVVKGVVTSEEGSNMRRKKFLVTRQDTNEKVDNPEVLEAMRLTIINNLLQYHPESSEQLAMGEAFGQPPKAKLDVDVATHITVKRDGPRSLLEVETADRPGLLLEILKVVRDISIYVESAEIDTEGLVAKDRFYVTYHGEVLSPSMSEVLTNSLRYYLRRPETEEDSY